jgi:hypothetical protein
VSKVRSEAAECNRNLVDLVTAELRSVTTGARNLTALRELGLPVLEGLLKEAGYSVDDLVRVLPEAFASIDDPVYRAAAGDLFPFPYTDAGWPKLAVRGRRAADRFGIGYDAFRRGGKGRSSRIDDVVRRVAMAVVSVLEDEPIAKVAALEVPQDESPPATDGVDLKGVAPGRHHPGLTRLIAAAGLVLLLTGGMFAAWIESRHGSNHPPAAAVPSCVAAVGQLDATLRAEPGASGLSARLRAAYERAGGDAVLGCTAGTAYRWQSLVVQEVVADGAQNGAVVLSPNGVDLYLSRGAMGSYHQLGGKDGDAAQTTGGLPLRIVDFSDGHVEIDLSTGTVLLAERADSPYFWIPSAYVLWWRNHPELGLPTGNPLPSQHQDFQHGSVSVNNGSPGDLTARLVDRPDSELPTLDSIRGHLLRQADATAWLVDGEGRRLWVPDGETWNCLGGDAARVGLDLPGYAIATLPFGGQARCPS